MSTVSQILTRAGQALGYTGRNEVLGANDANDALAAFNAMLDSWSNETLFSYVNLLSSVVLVPGTQTYSLTGTSRPLNIVQAYIRDLSGQDFPLEIVPQDTWNEITLKTTSSQLPTVLFYLSSFPSGVINLFPVPSIAYTLYYTWETDQVTYTSLTTSISMPQGYERAYILNLALEMMGVGFPCMLNERDYARLVNNAAEAKGNIKRTNIKEVVAEYDPAVLGQGTPYNIFTDE